jgi:hypothetical protein
LKSKQVYYSLQQNRKNEVPWKACKADFKKSALSRQNYASQGESLDVKLKDKNALRQRNWFREIEVAECARRVQKRRNKTRRIDK